MFEMKTKEKNILAETKMHFEIDSESGFLRAKTYWPRSRVLVLDMDFFSNLEYNIDWQDRNSLLQIRIERSAKLKTNIFFSNL